MSKSGTLRLFTLVLLAGLTPSQADISGRPDVAAFIQDMVARRRMDTTELTKLFQQADIQRKIVDAMDRPAESKPWWEYRKLVVTESHIQGGVAFWRRDGKLPVACGWRRPANKESHDCPPCL